MSEIQQQIVGDVPPPDEHAHDDVSKHIRGYLKIGGILLFGTLLTVALSYVDFGSMKANVAIAMLVATVKATLVGLVFMHLASERKIIYRVLIFTAIFVMGLFWLTYLHWYDPVVH
jgi:caa(3)-type oxidase subunit IV